MLSADKKQLRLVQKEPECVGTTATQLNAHRDKIVATLSAESQHNLQGQNLYPSDKRPLRLSRFFASISGKKKQGRQRGMMRIMQ